jgi:hypothetical protein
MRQQHDQNRLAAWLREEFKVLVAELEDYSEIYRVLRQQRKSRAMRDTPETECSQAAACE